MLETITSIGRKYFYLILIGLLIADTVFSYYQHSQFPIDGDVVSIVTPSEGYKTILEEPFGFKILKDGNAYAASNRFFAYWTTYKYFRIFPLFLQNFMSPIDSLYTAQAIAKILIQIGLIAILGLYISIPFGCNYKDFLLGSALITPLFHAVGCFEYMAIIDNCISYALAYALPSLLLLIFLFPYYKATITGNSGLPLWIKPLWIILAIILAFNGPLPSPILLIICPLTLIYFVIKKWNDSPSFHFFKRFFKALNSINKELLFSFSFVITLCLYSFYIGTYNLETIVNYIPLSERYERLLNGIVVILYSWNEGLTPLLLLIILNVILLINIKTDTSRKILVMLGLIFLFSVIYIALLPFGGYRDYRPFIMRRDTLQPVLLCMFFSWGISSICILKNITQINSMAYKYILFISCVVYTIADHAPSPSYPNECERRMLHLISKSNEDCIALPENCSVLAWGPFSDCNESTNAAIMLKYWNITSKEIHYYKPK